MDFRKLVKILAQHLKTRIELRQIGVRMKPNCLAVSDLVVGRYVVLHF
ncbi:PSP1 C-terminal domain-containing protein [Staphylococcus aureus]